MENLISSLFNDEAWFMLMIFTIAVVTYFNYLRDIKIRTISEIIYGDKSLKLEIKVIRFTLGSIAIIMITTCIIRGIILLNDNAGNFATNWWMMLLEVIVMGFFGWLGAGSPNQTSEYRYYIINGICTFIQLIISIDILAFIFK